MIDKIVLLECYKKGFKELNNLISNMDSIDNKVGKELVCNKLQTLRIEIDRVKESRWELEKNLKHYLAGVASQINTLQEIEDHLMLEIKKCTDHLNNLHEGDKAI